MNSYTLGYVDGFKITLILNLEDINDDVLIFEAEVIASRGGIHLGSAYLGYCQHYSEQEAVGDSIESCLGGYGPQLVDEAVREAQESLEALKEPEPRHATYYDIKEGS